MPKTLGKTHATSGTGSRVENKGFTVYEPFRNITRVNGSKASHTTDEIGHTPERVGVLPSYLSHPLLPWQRLRRFAVDSDEHALPSRRVEVAHALYIRGVVRTPGVLSISGTPSTPMNDEHVLPGCHGWKWHAPCP